MKFRNFAFLGLIISAFILAQPSNPVYALENNWPTYRADLANTGTINSSGPEIGQILWTYETGGPIWTSPAIVGQHLYIGSDDGNLYCVNSTNGEEIWRYSAYDRIAYSSPTVEAGRVFVGSYDDHLYSLNASNGSLLWDFTTGNNIISSPKYSDDKIYFGSTDGYVYALNASTGSLLWQYNTEDVIWSSPSIQNDILIITTKGFLLERTDIIWLNQM